MGNRIENLNSIDPLSIPLPHGTEVTTRVERQFANKKIPQGLIGRVTRARDGGFDIHIAGIGDVFYLREEIAPRKMGQLAFAVRRELAWNSLRNNVVIETTVGSRAWGLSDENSDTDIRGTFVLPFSWRDGLVEAPTELVSADGSATFWETNKMVEQALRADPNTLEMLFVLSAKPLDEMGLWILDSKEAFVSKLIFGSFGRYALSQLDKLQKTKRLAEHRQSVVEWLAANPSMTLDEVAGRLAKISPRTFANEPEALLASKTYIKQLYRSLNDLGLIEANDFKSLQKFASQGGICVAQARELKPKNAYNLLRLIVLATGWLREQAPNFEATGNFRQRLLDIKKGQVSLDEVLLEAESLSPDLEQAHKESTLPERPNVHVANELLKKIGQECARRFVIQSKDAWGVDAPLPPAPPEGEK
jgi:hypothetical protein